MIPEESKKLFLTKYSTVGSEEFYQFLLDYAHNRLAIGKSSKVPSPEIELMEYYNKFLVLYRKERDESYLDIAKLFRKAGHSIYRLMLKKGIIERNNRFLNLVS